MITYSLINEDGSIGSEKHVFSIPGGDWKQWLQPNWIVYELST